MLTGIEVAFVGGDARQLEIIQQLIEKDATVTLFGFDNWKAPYTALKFAELTPQAFSGIDALVLPAAGTDDQGKVEAIFSTQELFLTDEHFSHLPKKAKVYTGIAKAYLLDQCAQYGIEVVELFDRDDVAIYNSIPTTEGALMMAIQNTDITIHGSECMVLGMGRTGMTLVRTLKALGANVKVGVRRNEHFARAWEMGFNPFYLADLSREVRSVDLLFNTIPHMIVTALVIANLPHSAVIIDLASKPGGTDFRYAEKRGIKAMLAPGLPGIVAPKTAGRIIANCLTQLLSEDFKDRGN